MNRFQRALLSWSITAVFLLLVLRKIDWSEFAGQLRSISLLDLAGLIGIYLLGFALRGGRCRLLLPGLSFVQALWVVILGYAANNLLPARLGELVRAYYGAKRAQVPYALSLSTVFLERVLDGFTIVLLLLWSTRTLVLPEWADRLRIGGLLLFSLLLAGLMAAGMLRGWLEPYLPTGAIGRQVRELLNGLAPTARNPVLLFWLLASSLAVWLTEGWMFYFGFSVFGFTSSLTHALFVLGVVNLGVLIPSSPGNIGVFQYFATLALGVLAIDASAAAAYAVVVHACQYVPITLLGLLYWAAQGSRPSRVAEEALSERERNAAD